MDLKLSVPREHLVRPGEVKLRHLRIGQHHDVHGRSRGMIVEGAQASGVIRSCFPVVTHLKSPVTRTCSLCDGWRTNGSCSRRARRRLDRLAGWLDALDRSAALSGCGRLTAATGFDPQSTFTRSPLLRCSLGAGDLPSETVNREGWPVLRFDPPLINEGEPKALVNWPKGLVAVEFQRLATPIARTGAVPLD